MSSAPAMGQAGTPAPKKKSKTGCIAAACGSCLLVSVVICGTGGYLFYLEEGVSYTAPGTEVTEIPYVPGQPFAISTEWSGTGYATLRLYVDLGASAPLETRVSGTAACGTASDLAMGGIGAYDSTVDETYYYPIDSSHAGWVEVDDQYLRYGAEPVQCTGLLAVSPPVPTARLVLTRRQRPSDWLAGL